MTFGAVQCLQSPHVWKGSSGPTYNCCSHLLSLDWDTPAFTSLPWLCSLVALLLKFYYANLPKNLTTESISDIFNLVATLPSGSVGKESACTARAAGNVSLTPGSWRCPGNGNPLWSSCLGSPRDRGAWWAIIHGVVNSRKTGPSVRSSQAKAPEGLRMPCCSCHFPPFSPVPNGERHRLLPLKSPPPSFLWGGGAFWAWASLLHSLAVE